ncbi:MAG: SurA N-terminal domain-containing protein [Desulfamplus sp.]|nr:SurA N-terminal domain-containing protein [Desulfamplus sp.]
MVKMIVKTKKSVFVSSAVYALALLLTAVPIFIIAVPLMPAPARAELIDRIVAVVNNDVITLVELQIALSPYVDKLESSDYTPQKKKEILSQLTGDMLNRMIERKLTDQEAKRIRISVSDKEVDSAIENLKQSQLMSQEELEKALKDDGLSFADYKEKIREEILRPKLINYSIKSKVVITESDIKAYYESHSEEFAGKKKYYLRNILLTASDSASASASASGSGSGSDSASKSNSNTNTNTDTDTDTTGNEQKKRAEQIKARLDAGEDFKALAKEYSQASNASEGGDLGFFEWETLSDTIKKAIEPLDAGKHTNVISTDQGYQIFYVQEIQNQNVIPMNEVSKAISKKLYDSIVEKKFREWLDSLKEKSHIKIML